jgi:hypothetical protein
MYPFFMWQALNLARESLKVCLERPMKKRTITTIALLGLLPSQLLDAQMSGSPVPSTGPTTSVAIRTAPVPPDPCQTDRSMAKATNRINVEEPKMFDDATLQQTLEAMQGKLAGMSGFDQASLISHLGNVSGGTQSFTGTAFNIMGPSVPSRAITTAPANTSTATTYNQTSDTGSQYPGTTTENQTITTNNPAANSTVTTYGAVTPTAATPAAAPPAVTTGYGVQSSAVFQEQTQLQAQLEMSLLSTEGALSDRLMRFENSWRVKPRATLGFAVTPSPTRDEKDQAAVVEVIISNCHELVADMEPSVTAILPTEKTYNTAQITSSTNNIGAGIATQLVGVSAGFLWGKNSYYLVQDQDTVAQVFSPDDNDPSGLCSATKCIGVRWIFRPTLGQRIVTPERRQAMVQVAFPSDYSAMQYGRLTLRTYWRKFDRKNGLVGDVVSGTPQENVWRWPIQHYTPDVNPDFLAVSGIEDLHNGQVLVRMEYPFLAGTYIRVGNTTLSDGMPGFIRENNAIRFVASIADLATKQTYLVGRDGGQYRLAIHNLPGRAPISPAVSLRAIDNANTRLIVQYCEPTGADPLPKQHRQMVVVVGSQVFGYSDQPLFSTVNDPRADCKSNHLDTYTLSTTLPNSTLLASPSLMLTSLFDDGGYTTPLSLMQSAWLTPLSQPDRLVLLKVSKDSGEFLLYGNRLSSVTNVEPNVVLENPPAGNAEDGIRLVTLSAKLLDAYKFLVLSRKGEAPEAVAIPSVTLPTSASSSLLTADRVDINTDSVKLTGKGLGDLQKVMYGDKQIHFKVAEDGTSVTLQGLRSAGVTAAAAIHTLQFFFKSQPVGVKLDVVDRKVETVSR